MTKEERLRKQLARLTEMKQTEQELHRAGYRYIAGVDEVGRGPLAGPVVAAAVVLPADFDVPGIDDSKKLSEKRREQLYDMILDRAIAWGIGEVSWELIDEINILEATKQAMGQALQACDAMLRERTKAGIMPAGAPGAQGGSTETQNEEASEHGGIDYVLLDAVQLPQLALPQLSIIKGDAKVLCIAAASIVAKVWRDRKMAEYAKEYPGYGFEKNKGYGTKEHYAGIRAQGICPIHRRSFLKKMH